MTHYLQNLLGSSLLYGGIYALLLKINPHYSTYFMDATVETFWVLLVGWFICAVVGYAVMEVRDPSFRPLGYRTLFAWKKFFSTTWQFLRDPKILKQQEIYADMNHEERNLVLKFCVKMFFFPLMVQFFWLNVDQVLNALVGTAPGQYSALFWQLKWMGQLQMILWTVPKELVLLVVDGISKVVGLPTHGLLIQGFEQIMTFYDGVNPALKTTWFFVLFQILILVDVTVFMIAYILESRFLGNEIKSVEPTLFGWTVALMCYPIFNDVSGKIIGWYANEQHATFYNAGVNPDTAWIPAADTVMMAIVLALFVIYVWATVALGMKSGNLVNRGIIARGPYRFVRHPAYVTKTAAWMVSSIPFMLATILSIVSSLKAAFGGDLPAESREVFLDAAGSSFLVLLAAIGSVLTWTLVYYFRATTEERHLMRDPDYLAYQQRVKWRYIPEIW